MMWHHPTLCSTLIGAHQVLEFNGNGRYVMSVLLLHVPYTSYHYYYHHHHHHHRHHQTFPTTKATYTYKSYKYYEKTNMSLQIY